MSGGDQFSILPEEIHHLGHTWILLGDDLTVPPPSPGDAVWPTAAITAGLHGYVQQAGDQLRTRLTEGGGQMQDTANKSSATDTMKVVQDMVQTITKPITDVTGQMAGLASPVGAFFGAALGAVGTVVGQLVSALSKSSAPSPVEQHDDHEHVYQEAV